MEAASLVRQAGGMTVLADNDWWGFSTQFPRLRAGLRGWHRYGAGNTGRRVNDPSAGCGSHNALEVTFPAGTRQGIGPEHLSVGGPTRGIARLGRYRELYLSYCVWVPRNYQGSASGVQKLFHIWGTANTPRGFNTQGVPALYGVGGNQLHHQLRLQNMGTGNGGKTSFNLFCGPAQRGRWDRVEILLTQNTWGQPDGSARMWLNGSPCLQANNLTWSGAHRTGKRWMALQLNPTYGTKGSVATTQRIRYGAVQVRAK